MRQQLVKKKKWLLFIRKCSTSRTPVLLPIHRNKSDEGLKSNLLCNLSGFKYIDKNCLDCDSKRFALGFFVTYFFP